MLRALVLLLLLANAGFWAWRHSWLEPLHGVIGARPEGEREPERLSLQVDPDRIRLIPAEAASMPASAPASAEPAAAASAPAATACLEVGPYSVAELAVAEAAVKAALPDAGWSERELTTTWWVAMGPFAETEQLQKKREELKRRSIAPELASAAPGSAPLLVISRHDSRAAADTELATLLERGVRTARVVSATVPQRALRVAQASEAQQATLAALPADKLRGKAFTPCPADTL
ncbi:hypothetical protein [Methylibium sp.]|uniref:hypothetical protein n=1 Tax=Methylibium sp. TaxID=2067992 RepID=UPI003D136D35